MKTVPLGGKKAAGRVVLVDDEDYELVVQYRWHLYESSAGVQYARTNNRGVFMHQLITGYPLTDHRNGDGLDNQRYNLRSATVQENARNSRGCRSSSRFKGVCMDGKSGRWRATITLTPGRKSHIGFYDTEEDAARAYDAVAQANFGEFVRLNFPPPQRASAVSVPSPGLLAEVSPPPVLRRVAPRRKAAPKRPQAQAPVASSVFDGAVLMSGVTMHFPASGQVHDRASPAVSSGWVAVIRASHREGAQAS